MMKKMKEKALEVEAPAPAGSSKTAPAAAPESKTAGPMMSTAPPRVEGPRPLMSAELPRPGEPEVAPADFSKAVQSGHVWGDRSDLAVIGRIAKPEELAEFRKTIEARRKAERDQPRPADTLWHCARCGFDTRMGADQKRQPCCFRCNSMLSKSGPMMTRVISADDVAAFLERERVEKERWQKSLAKAKELAAKRNAELDLLRRHGL